MPPGVVDEIRPLRAPAGSAQRVERGRVGAHRENGIEMQHGEPLRLRGARRARDGRRERDRRGRRRAAARRRRGGARLRPRERRRRARLGPAERGGRAAAAARRARLLRGRRRRLAPHRGGVRRGVGARPRDQPERRVLREPRGDPEDEGGRLRADRQRRLDRRQGREPDGGRLLVVEGRGDRDHEGDRQGRRRQRDPRQLHRARGDQHADPRARSRRSTSPT